MTHVTSYVPKSAPATTDKAVADLARYVEHELGTIARALQEFSYLKLTILHSEPERPREGMVVFADGSDWNPGSGGGPYAYFGGSWVILS